MSEENNINKNEMNLKNLKINKSCNDLYNKNYDYPFLKRKDLMSLSTINNNDFPIKKFKQLNTNRDWSLNLYNLDIEGTSPRKFGQFFNKIDFTNKNSDIEKSSPYIPKILNKPNYNLSNEDIENSKPNCAKCKMARNTNPLMPKYSLPKCEEMPIENNTKFIRNTLDIDDIEGAKPKKFISTIFLRDSLNKDDLKDSFPKKPYIRKDKYNNMDYNDIYKIVHKSKRNTNPLMPIYNWKYPINNMRYSVGPIEGNFPSPFSKYKYINPFNLRNDDIEDSNPGSKNKFKKYKGSNSCLNIKDINKAFHGSLLKGIDTKRNTNPLAPKYKYLGEEELKNEKMKMISVKSNINIKNEKLNNSNKNNNTNNLIEKNEKIELINSNNENSNLKENIKEDNRNSDKILINKDKINNENITKNEGDTKINKIISELNNLCPNDIDNEVKFDKNNYKKPDIYYPYIHEEVIIPYNKQYNKGGLNFNPRLRSFQQVINEKIRLKYEPRINIIPKNPKKSYENKMDDFFVKSTIDMYKSQQKLKNNINAYYDIGFPEELKSPDIDGKF